MHCVYYEEWLLGVDWSGVIISLNLQRKLVIKLTRVLTIPIDFTFKEKGCLPAAGSVKVAVVSSVPVSKNPGAAPRFHY